MVSVETRLQTEQGPFPKFNRMTHRPHGVKVEAQVVDSIQNLGQNFVRCIEVAKVCSGVAAADPAATIGVEGPFVARVFGLLDRDFPL